MTYRFVASCHIYPLIHRGRTFRKEIAELKVMRSITPPGVNMMALSASASKATHTHIINMLGMEKPSVISKSPSKWNVFLSVKMKVSLKTTFAPYLERY